MSLTIPVSSSEAVSTAARILTEGGVVIAPTETAYAVLADATRSGAVARMAALKGRDPQKATSVFVRDLSALGSLAVLSNIALRVAHRFLPGPLTLVLPVSDVHAFASGIANAEGEVGFRVSSFAFIQELVRAVEFPLTATSANTAGEPPCYALSDLPVDLFEGVDLCVDGGRIPTVSVSTVVRISSFGERTILREGAIPSSAILSV